MATNPITKAKLPAKMTPLWVISLFVFLTEVIAGIAATQTTGNLQAALVWFVIIFPFLVVSMFFSLLWFRPWTFYPPSEYANVDVQRYVEALRGGPISIVRETKDVQGDVEIAGDPDRLKLLFKADGGTWVRSTKAMDVGPGCVVQMSTQFLTPQGWNAAEALTYVPDTMIVGEEEGDGHYLVHKHQQTEDGDA
jgi:hypothetical protein